MSINDPGQPGTIQRLVYDAARVESPAQWRRLNSLAHTVLETIMSTSDDLDNDPQFLLVNSLCIATQRVVSMQRHIHEALHGDLPE